MKSRRFLFTAYYLLLAFPALAADSALVIRTVAGTGQAGYAGDGGRAEQAQLNNPFGIVRGPDGALYICDTGNHVIRRVDKEGVIRTVAGTGQAGYAGDGGPATLARLNEPYEIRFDRDGNYYFVEMRNHIVRRVNGRTGRIATVAGTGEAGFAGDGGPAVEALFRQPHSIQLDRHGDIWICDIGNHRLRLWDHMTGSIRTVGGTGEAGKTPDGAKLEGTPLHGPRAVDFDATGHLWLALREGNAVFRIDPESGEVRHMAGTGAKGFTGHEGPAREATLSGPKGISVGPDGRVYLADTESHSIRYLDPVRGTLHVLAGTGERGDGPEGNPRECRLARPHGVFADRDGKVYIGDSEAHRVRVVEARMADETP